MGSERRMWIVSGTLATAVGLSAAWAGLASEPDDQVIAGVSVGTDESSETAHPESVPGGADGERSTKPSEMIHQKIQGAALELPDSEPDLDTVQPDPGTTQNVPPPAPEPVSPDSPDTPPSPPTPPSADTPPSAASVETPPSPASAD